MGKEIALADQDLVIFDTSTLPEYYDDRALALPAGHIVTYDYSARQVSTEAQAVLRSVSETCKSLSNGIPAGGRRCMDVR
jgi:hypothetical protein